MNEKLRKIKEICKKYQIRVMYFFGSRGLEFFQVVNNAGEISNSKSDLDVGVLTQSDMTIDDKVNLTFELESIFENTKVDLFLLREIDTFLAANIIRGERIYAQDEYEADEYDLYVLRRAGDLAEFERQRMAMILGEE